MRRQEAVSGQGLQPEVVRPLLCQPLLGCVDGRSVLWRKELVTCQVVSDDLQT